MSSPTWTPAALASELAPYQGGAWRLVEAQHKISTLKLVDTAAEQALLEGVLEDHKPAYPEGCEGLHYLLKTPFRYGAAYPHGSRFRRAGRTPGVFYAAERPQTAVAEMAYYRLLFFAESPGTPWPANPAEFTAFRVEIATDRHLDLTRPPLSTDAALWTALSDYSPCQDLADQARAKQVQALRYLSVRDPGHGCNLALLTPTAFAKPKPTATRTWRLRLSATGVQALCEAPRAVMDFGREAFSADGRLAGMVWER